MRNHFGILDAFGDTSLIESLNKQFIMTSPQNSETTMTSSKDDEDHLRPRRSRIAGMAVSSMDYFEKMNQLSIDDGQQSSGSVTRRNVPLNQEAEVSWKNVEKYVNDDHTMD